MKAIHFKINYPSFTELSLISTILHFNIFIRIRGRILAALAPALAHAPVLRWRHFVDVPPSPGQSSTSEKSEGETKPVISCPGTIGYHGHYHVLVSPPDSTAVLSETFVTAVFAALTVLSPKSLVATAVVFAKSCAT